MKLDPGHGMAHYGMGAAFHYKGCLARAIEAYIKAGEVHPSLVEALSDLGRAYFESGLLEAAVQAYQKAIRLRPGLAPTISNLGEVYAAQGKMDEAIDAYRAALEVDPSLSGSRRQLEHLLWARALRTTIRGSVLDKPMSAIFMFAHQPVAVSHVV